MRCDFVNDISCKNDVLSVPVSPMHHFSAVVWTMPSTNSLLIAQYNCLSYALQKLTTHFHAENLWLIAGHGTWQPDNRVTRHNRFWKSLHKMGVPTPEGELLDESMQTSASSIRFFGAIRCHIGQIKAIHAVMRETQAAAVFFPAADTGKRVVQGLVQNGWEMANSKPPEEILVAACAQQGLVIEVYGNFDDPDVSVAAIGKSVMLANFVSE
jgi:hypothetical protein